MTLHIGDRVTAERMLRGATPGTLLRRESSTGPRATRFWLMDNGQWETLNGVHHTHDYHSAATVVQSYGPLIVEDVPLDGGPSLLAAKWAVRNGALHAVYYQGVREDIAFDVLRKARATDEEFPWSPDQKVGNKYDLQRIPTGSLVHIGRPTNLDAYTIYEVVSKGVFNRILGNGEERLTFEQQPSVWIDSIAGAPPPGTWTTDPPGSPKDIAIFKKAVWDAGWEYKRSQGWCETYEAIMRRLGVNEDGR